VVIFTCLSNNISENPKTMLKMKKKLSSAAMSIAVVAVSSSSFMSMLYCIYYWLLSLFSVRMPA